MPNRKQNVGFIDRLVRGLLAIDLLALCFSSFINGVAVLISIILIALLAYSGATGHCPLYTTLGRNSRHRTEP
ncbi:YgaP family membrane protein [Fibrella forsythiae]|uniref:DUF2892 domain-containing protein n=1 Tax=Fibrella forsythiae TaxID=2817061 RepID=A0ABS3JMA0_9BACT|nr:DUF2892 domain-containing protein [Fibrella forsythiae]MBO0951131.1 DUF2892 domain-containing protein [Fibrella forsythiae]